MTATQKLTKSKSIPVTCFTGFLGAGKTSTILGLLGQLPKDYRVVLLKNEYGDVEVDSQLAQQSSIAGVSEILNGCMCCTLVGQIQTAMLEIRDTMNPDRIIIESSGSAFPATLAIQIRQLADEGFALDSVVTVIDCVNFTGYEDSSPTAKIQAKYTDCLLLNKHDLVTERQLDNVLDHLYELNDETPMIRVSKQHPLDPSLVFGLDTKLFARGSEEIAEWGTIVAAGANGGVAANHSDEIETVSVWRGGGRPGKGNAKKRGITEVDGKTKDGAREEEAGHMHKDGENCACATGNGEVDQVEENGTQGPVPPVDVEALTAGLAKLPFEIYRVKGFLRVPSKQDPTVSDIHILNWAFGRSEITPAPTLNDSDSLKGVSFRLTMMGARGEVTRRARTFATLIQGEYA